MNLDIQKLIGQATSTVETWAEAFFAMLPNLALAAAIVVGFGLLSGLVRSAAKNLMDRATTNEQLASLAASVARVAVIVIGLFLALSVLHLDKTVTSMLAGLGVVGVALGFAFQDIASNFMSGVMMAVRHPFAIGDFVETGGHAGIVNELDLRSTTLLRTDGVHVTLPNSDVFGNAIINFTRQNPRRVEIEVGVAYGTDLERVETICHEVGQSMDNLLEDQPIDVLFTEFGGSSVNLILRFWTDNSLPGGWLKSRSNAIKAIHRRFEEEGIDIPFPIRTLDMPKNHVADFVNAFPSFDRSESSPEALPNK